ncbi:hypothetical protein F8S13_25110 [Chloroflexia bacterium SDU3-3]|nr:hypothetical protein F8S13_25110 [Chloroflexia bacterium SDU3-3]
MRLPPAALVAISLISLVAIALLLPGGGTPALVSQWQPGAQPPAAAAPTVAPAPQGGLDVALPADLYPGQEAAIRAQVGEALAYVSARFGGGAQARLTASFVADASCGLQGIAYTDVRDVQVFTCPSIAPQRAVNILAHELVHQLEQDRYGERHLSADLILSEGMATYGAGKYWLGGQPDFRSFVQAQRAAGDHYPLATHYAGLGIAAMNTLYYEWASFVEFLIGRYGREKFDALYVSGAGAPGSADYAGVYGKDLPALEQEWLAWLDER